jgi:integrase
MVIAIKQAVKGIENPWYVIVNEKGRISARKFPTHDGAYNFALQLRGQSPASEFGRSSYNSSPEFSRYVEHYIDKYVKAVCKRNTLRNYKQKIRIHILPAWQDKRIDQIKRSDVIDLLLNKSAQGLAPATVACIKAVISSIFQLACEEGLLESNPVARLGKFIRKKDKRTQKASLTKEQASQFLDVIKKEFPKYYAFFLCAFRTGMRIGELLALAWEDLHMERNLIEVKRSYSGGTLSSPKNGKSRLIDMSEQLKSVLLEHRKSLMQGGSTPCCPLTNNGAGSDTIHLVFPNRKGKPMDGSNIKHWVFYKVIKKLGLSKFRFHDIRHTFASLLLQQGESLHYVKEQMGHSSIQITVDIYGYIVPGSNRKAVNKLDDRAKSETRLAQPRLV